MKPDLQIAKACDADALSIKNKLNAIYPTESSTLDPSVARLQSIAIHPSDKE